MSYHGFGVTLAIGGRTLQTVNTTQPVTQTRSIPDLSTFKELIVQEIKQPYIQPQEPSRQIVSAGGAVTGGHRAPEADPLKTFSEQIASRITAPSSKCAAGQFYDVLQGKCRAWPTTPSSGGRVDLQTQQTRPPTAGAVVDVVGNKIFQGGKDTGYVTDTTQEAGAMTLEGLKAACKQSGGTMGTPNCCKMSDGAGGFINAGVQNGQLVGIVQCDVGGNLPLIAGAAVIALLLARGM